ncbi:MAG: Rieske (2Fe-2S) domain protein [Actinomycetia bacterium]|nr:Rieske (2Fe-2S) domain protein [Actinomycetes bacterium]
MTPEGKIAACFGVTTVSAVGLAVVYWNGGQTQLEGALLGAAFGGLSIGVVLLADKLLPGGGQAEDRHPLDSPELVDEAVEHQLAVPALTRRRLLTRSLGAAVGALAVAAAFPLRSLGPRPGNSLLRTSWRAGRRVVTTDGRVVRAADVPLGGLVTVYPEGARGVADSQVVLVRVEPSLLQPRPGREDWAPDGLLAYSKVCTHAGCPVGLYEAQRHELLCPCHQSAFDVLDGARPVFGPAAAELPQLPLAIAEDGTLHATGDFSDPVGPAFWHRT